MARGIELHGLDELRSAVERLAREAVNAADAGHRQLAERAAQDMRGSVPVDTGRLRGTIRTEYPNQFGARVTAGDDSTPYLGAVEYGTRKMAARPFARAAIARAEAAHESTMLDQARKRIR